MIDVTTDQQRRCHTWAVDDCYKLPEMNQQERLLSQLGFRFGINGPHAARTMMLADLRLLMDQTSARSVRADYAAAVIQANVLGKPTRRSRELAYRHLATLYGLDVTNPLFCALRRLWSLNESAQPMLALAVALARDPLLRATQNFFLQLAAGAGVSRESVERLLDGRFPGRFSAASLKSFAQNIAGTWTSAGVLQGRLNKTRSAIQPQPESIALLLFLGYLEGRAGERLTDRGQVVLVLYRASTQWAARCASRLCGRHDRRRPGCRSRPKLDFLIDGLAVRTTVFKWVAASNQRQACIFSTSYPGPYPRLFCNSLNLHGCYVRARFVIPPQATKY